MIVLDGELLSSLFVICRTSIHTALLLECLVIKTWIVECESCVTSRLLCYSADENINKLMICHGTKANIVALAVRILGHLDISVVAFHLPYSFNVGLLNPIFLLWPEHRNLNAHRTDFPFKRKDYVEWGTLSCLSVEG